MSGKDEPGKYEQGPRRRGPVTTASGTKRAKELARAKAERQADRRAAAAARARRRSRIVSAVMGATLVVGGLAYLLWPSSTPVASVKPKPSPTPTSKPSWALTSAVSCSVPPQVRTSDLSFAKDPAPASSTSKYLTLDTNCGSIRISMLPGVAPKTVASMSYLATHGYFDRTKCHRLTTAGLFVLQCGDPTGTGSGGPGYTVPDENLPGNAANNYPAGTVAMANSGANTNGSQFFIVFADTTLGPNYTIWGHVESGLDVARYVANRGVIGGQSDGPPAQALVITKATVS